MIAKNIKDKREQLGFSQQQLADKVGVSKSMIALIETDRRIPNSPLLRDIAKALDTSMDSLMA